MGKMIYKTSAKAEGGREGKVKSEDGVLDLQVAVPESMGGSGGAFTNPEQLFAAGYAACFDSALNYVAKAADKEIESKTTATVGLNAQSATDLDLEVTLDIEISGVDKDDAQKLLEKAHATCPYSKALDGNVDVTVNLK
ncbi:organic hydroperoxide resistance protein [Gracilimonas mengyeensis]|uniref:Peroxiredoxin, Ohr subfamily n=1 Tax=Gracilimonas mengyeensis TaxID=1302730 RepID=A0A521F641_9BACT|nr:organic hydroperoxide resistance protein [Gracilimonas mengyeensis]SMO91617.1 peroxiredoxin, Ohr subfamily [Gracilimonas mengyeensis]